MILGYAGVFILLFALLRRVNYTRISATIFALCMSSSAVPIYGLALFRPIYGSNADALVGMVALTTNLTQISVAVFLLETSLKSVDNAWNRTSLLASTFGFHAQMSGGGFRRGVRQKATGAVSGRRRWFHDLAQIECPALRQSFWLAPAYWPVQNLLRYSVCCERCRNRHL